MAHKQFSQSFLNRGACLALLFFLCLSCGNRQITKYTDEAIKNSPELQELDKVCAQIPLPPGFQFIRKDGTNKQKTLLAYLYRSETEYETARALWTKHFTENGWKKVKEDDSDPKIMEFRNEKFRIATAHGDFGQSNYTVTCEKLSIDNKTKAINFERNAENNKNQ